MEQFSFSICRCKRFFAGPNSTILQIFGILTGLHFCKKSLTFHQHILYFACTGSNGNPELTKGKGNSLPTDRKFFPNYAWTPLAQIWGLISSKYLFVGSGICWKRQAVWCSSCIHVYILRFTRWHSWNKRLVLFSVRYNSCLCKTSQKAQSFQFLLFCSRGWDGDFFVESCSWMLGRLGVDKSTRACPKRRRRIRLAAKISSRCTVAPLLRFLHRRRKSWP